MFIDYGMYLSGKAQDTGDSSGPSEQGTWGTKEENERDFQLYALWYIMNLCSVHISI